MNNVISLTDNGNISCRELMCVKDKTNRKDLISIPVIINDNVNVKNT